MFLQTRDVERGSRAAPADAGFALQLVVEVLEIFLELLVRQHFLEAAPRGLAALALVTDALVHPVEQPVVIGAVLGRTAQEFIVEIESLVVSFRHLAAQIPDRKSTRLNSSHTVI